jgi:hypothetical protein
VIVFLVVGGLALQNRRAGNETDPIPAVAVSTAPSDPTPTQPRPEVIGSLLGHFPSNPLETEARLLASDTEDALRFLASNFVPSENRKQSRL